MFSAQPLAPPPQNANANVVAGIGGSVQPHHGVVGIVLLAVIVLIVLDRVGFRFAVTAGRR
jgi:hypothetical protein